MLALIHVKDCVNRYNLVLKGIQACQEAVNLLRKGRRQKGAARRRSNRVKSLLVALDDTPASEAALQFSLSLASRFGAGLTGISILDIAHLTAPEPVPLGGAHYKFKLDLVRLERAHRQAVKFRERFLGRCRSAGVIGRAVMLEGSPADEVRATAAVHDVIVIGRDTDFHSEPSGGLANTVEQILKGNPRPLVITPQAVRPPLSRILIAYDGSIPAARALQIFTLLGLARDCELHVVSVDPDLRVAERKVREASAYTELYGYGCDKHAIKSATDPSEVVTGLVSHIGADVLVMGAYGHRGWREALLGSCTTRLLSKGVTSLFVYH
jgi:nucleotide-binding universal stress UspA family protein